MEQTLSISQIRIDQAAQQRERLSEETVKEYAEAYLANCKFPPPDVFFDGEFYWLGGGFHRVAAAGLARLTEIKVWVHKGGLREAILFSCSANATNGLRRTNADKKRAVLTLLNDPEWREWSRREIAKKCAVSHSFVNDIADELSGSGVRMPTEVKFSRRGQTHRQSKGNRSKANKTQKDSDYWSDVISAAYDLQKILECPLAISSREKWPWHSELQNCLNSLQWVAGTLKGEAQTAEVKAQWTDQPC